MASSDSSPESVVLRPSWHAAAAIGALIVILLVPLALAFDENVAQAVVYAVVFSFVFGLANQRRTVELTPDAATVNEVWRQRSIARNEVHGVARGQWWNGGIRLSTGGKDFWLRVSDRPFGQVSDERFAIVVDWAASADTND